MSALLAGGTRVRCLLREQYSTLFEDYLSRLHMQTDNSPDDEGLVDRNTRLACDLHAHKLLLFRNSHAVGLVNEKTVASLLASFVFLTGRHTFNLPVRQKGALLVPESEVYELLSHVRHSLVGWRYQKRGPIDRVMQTAASFYEQHRFSSRVRRCINSKIVGRESEGERSRSFCRKLDTHHCSADGRRGRGQRGHGRIPCHCTGHGRVRRPCPR